MSEQVIEELKTENQELKDKLQSQAMEFENYKTECKQLEQFLEEESTKKEEEIRKLKEDAIKKQKNYNLLKTQVSQLQAENANIKAELKEKQGTSTDNQNTSQEIKSLKEEIDKLTNENTELKKSRDSLQAAKVSLIEEHNGKIAEFETSIKTRENIIKDFEVQTNSLKKYIDELKSQKEPKSSNKSSPPPPTPPKTEKVNHEDKNQKAHEQLKTLHRTITETKQERDKAQQKAIKLSKQLKQTKQKLQYLSTDRDGLSKKVKELTVALSRKSKQQITERQKQEQHFEEEIEEYHENTEIINLKDNILFNAMIMTKKHYVSPFLQFKGDNGLKIYKNTKNGCFQKSLGALKFKLNEISYDTEKMVNQYAQAISENLKINAKTSLIFYGAKRTSKKYLMANTLDKLKQELVNLIDGADTPLQAKFIKASIEHEKRAEYVGKDREEILDIIDRVISMNQKSPKKHDGQKKKVASKPKVRYFSLSIDGETLLELITTSHTNIYSRQSTNLFEALNNICYSKLPNCLQMTDSQKIIALTVNPIVNLYEDCKNTLSIVNCKKTVSTENEDMMEWQGSPIKDDMLNDTARKKLESIEKESEQNSLKMRRLEEEILYYRTKFDDLEVRLKNLLNTHGSQNSYLKKSPVTLSYEKMLKFVHSVLARNGQSMSHSPGLQKTSQTFNIDDEYGSHSGSGEEIF